MLRHGFCSAGTVVNLNVTLGGCQYNFSYGYYAAPLVSGVQPESGPRYGSFPLTVFLEDSLDSVSHGKVCPCSQIGVMRQLQITNSRSKRSVTARALHCDH